MQNQNEFNNLMVKINTDEIWTKVDYIQSMFRKSVFIFSYVEEDLVECKSEIQLPIGTWKQKLQDLLLEYIQTIRHQ